MGRLGARRVLTGVSGDGERERERELAWFGLSPLSSCVPLSLGFFGPGRHGDPWLLRTVDPLLRRMADGRRWDRGGDGAVGVPGVATTRRWPQPSAPY